MKTETIQPHTLFVSDSKTEIKGISGVSHYSDKELCFQIKDGSVLLTGNNLNMENLNVEGGIAIISGEILSVKYKKGNLNLLKRLTK